MIGQTIASFSSPISLNIMTMVSSEERGKGMEKDLIYGILAQVLINFFFQFSTLWFTENRRATAGMFIGTQLALLS